MSKTFFTSDTHFGHANIIRYSKRPFLLPGDVVTINGKEEWANKSIKKSRADEMDALLYSNWNTTIGPNDTVYHLGDLCFGDTKSVLNCLSKLNGRINFIYGNHDSALRVVGYDLIHFYADLKNRIRFLGDYQEVVVEGQEITLAHYAMHVWNRSHHGSWNLYGHSHGSLPDDPHAKAFDVGVDCHNFKPLSFQEVKTIMAKKEFRAVDHHREK